MIYNLITYNINNLQLIETIAHITMADLKTLLEEVASVFLLVSTGFDSSLHK